MTGSAPRSVLPPWPLALGVIGLCALVATAAPLLTYTLSLAALGGAHVLGELRFVEARFAARLEQRLLWGLGLLLAGVLLLRGAKALDLWGGAEATRWELGIVAGLGALTLPTLAGRGALALALGILVVGAVGVGLLLAPIWTILLLACLHNWTPVGFLAEGLPTRERRKGLWLGLLAFGILPLLIASGLPGEVLGALGAHAPELTLLSVGRLADHLGAYLPRSLHEADGAVAAFSALVFAQCMHYATVLGVLPRIAPGGARAPRLPWALSLSRLPTRGFVLGVALLSGLALVGYAADFSEARQWYGLIAAVHAWVELPLLLLALPSGAAALSGRIAR